MVCSVVWIFQLLSVDVRNSNSLLPIGKKVKVTLVQALRLCTGHMACRGSRGIALPFHDHGTRRGWGVSVTLRPLLTPGKDAVPIVQEAGWAPGPVWTGAENLAPLGFDPRTVQPVAIRYTDYATWPTIIRSPDRPAHSQLLYRLSYCGPHSTLMTLLSLHITAVYLETKNLIIYILLLQKFNEMMFCSTFTMWSWFSLFVTNEAYANIFHCEVACWPFSR